MSISRTSKPENMITYRQKTHLISSDIITRSALSAFLEAIIYENVVFVNIRVNDPSFVIGLRVIVAVERRREPVYCVVPAPCLPRFVRGLTGREHLGYKKDGVAVNKATYTMRTRQVRKPFPLP